MSSVTTAIPSGSGFDWCIHPLYAEFASTDIFECANSSQGTKDSDFETICCDGAIVDQSQDLWSLHRDNGPHYLDIANLVCCQIEGPQAGGLMPLVSNNGLTCSTGTPTPLASMAATNVKNAQIYPLTFTSASGESPNIGDMLWTSTPYCLWADTAHGIAMKTVTVPAAKITTLPNGWPDSYNPLIYPATPTSTFGVPRGSSAVVSATRISDASGTSFNLDFPSGTTDGTSTPAITSSSATSLDGAQALTASQSTSTTSSSSAVSFQSDKIALLVVGIMLLMACML